MISALQHVGRFGVRLTPKFSQRLSTCPSLQCQESFFGGRRKYPLWNVSLKLTSRNLSTSTATYQRMVETKARPEIEVDIRKESEDVEIKWSDGESSRYANIWLKHNCHCSLCKQEHSGQRLVDALDIDQESIPSEVKVTGNGCLDISWVGTNQHNTIIPLDWLRENCYSQKNREQNLQMRRIHPLKGDIPVHSYSDISNKEDALFRWICDINEHGVAMVTGVPCEDNEVAKVAELIAPVQRTIYGKPCLSSPQVFDVMSVPKPINIAYSSTKLGFHMDLVYYESPPGLQLLHALRFDLEVEGGESIFLDAHYMAEVLREKYPHHFKTLVRVPASFQKIHFERDWPVYMQYQRPHIVVNSLNEVTCVTWAPAFEAPLHVPEEDVKPYYEAYHVFARLLEESDAKLRHRLQPGECVIFNNRRMLHARDAYTQDTGSRHLQGCYVNIDEFKNKVQVMMTKRNTGQFAKRVGNQCQF